MRFRHIIFHTRGAKNVLPMSIPKFLQDKVDRKDPLNPAQRRKRSGKRESGLAKELGGRATVNSGATFGENDVVTDYAEIEDKTTLKNTYSLSADYLEEVAKKCALSKIPILTVHFETRNKTYAVIPWEDLKFLLER